ncbi:hypothetical protein MRX96_043511 [Rhipicephalus microplus]
MHCVNIISEGFWTARSFRHYCPTLPGRRRGVEEAPVGLPKETTRAQVAEAEKRRAVELPATLKEPLFERAQLAADRLLKRRTRALSRGSRPRFY